MNAIAERGSPGSLRLALAVSGLGLLFAASGNGCKEGALSRPAARAVDAAPRLAGPSLDDYWDGKAEWVEDSAPGLPDAYPGDVLNAPDGSGEVWAYTHQAFPDQGVPEVGCAVLYRSRDGGRTFSLYNPRNNPDNPCLFYDPANAFPVDGRPFFQQQYPSVVRHRDRLVMAYEVGGGHFWRESRDGIHWSGQKQVPGTGNCPAGGCGASAWEARHAGCDRDPADSGSMRGSVPGLYSDGARIYDFYGAGSYPASMGVLHGADLSAVEAYGPLFTSPYDPARCGADLSVDQVYAKYATSANAIKMPSGRHYMTFEGQRRVGEWGLLLARTGPGAGILSQWDVSPQPIAALGPYIGAGHASLYVRDGTIYLYRGVRKLTRDYDGYAPNSRRFRLRWIEPERAEVASVRTVLEDAGNPNWPAAGNRDPAATTGSLAAQPAATTGSSAERPTDSQRRTYRVGNALRQAKRARQLACASHRSVVNEAAAQCAADAFGDSRTHSRTPGP